MVRAGILRSSRSPWCSPILYVLKPDATLRMVIDYIALNRLAESCGHPLPKISTMLASFSGMRYFSSLDLVKGFWQIGLEESSIPISAITTPLGLYEFTRLPFGINSGPGIFQSIMMQELRGLEANVMVYIDDILVFTPTFEKHLEILQEVFVRLERANLKVSPKKCEFARTELIYLGLIINSKGISTNPEKVKAVEDLPEPKDVKDVQSIMGKLNYYAHFIPDFAKVARPLNLLRRKNAVWKWGTEEAEAFATLKERLCSAPVLRHPDFEQEFILATDASGYGLGAVLSQLFEEEEHPIAYASRTLLVAECRYSGYEREALCLKWAILRFDLYLDGPRHFTVYTDHKPLCSMMFTTPTNLRVLNYATRIAGYNFTVKYRKGSSNSNADTLSRYPVIPIRRVTDADAPVNAVCSIPKTGFRARSRSADSKVRRTESGPESKSVVHALLDSRPEPDPSDEEEAESDRIIALQNSNPLFRALRHYIEFESLAPGDKELEVEVRSSAHFYTLGPTGILLRRNPCGDHVMCTPEGMRLQAIHDAHDVDMVLHGGREKTLRRLTSQHWWPKLYRDVEKYLKNCLTCSKFKRARKIRQPLGERPPPERVWERVHLDLWQPGGTSVGGNKYVAAFIDTVSKYVVAECIPDKTAETIARVFTTKVVCMYGMPDELYTDGGGELIGTLVSQLSKAFGVSRKVTTPYHPQANGQIERVFSTIRPMIAAAAAKHPQRWDEVIPYVVYAYNTSFHRSIRNIPFYLFFGRDTLFDHLNLNRVIRSELIDSNATRLKLLGEARDIVLQTMKREARKRKIAYDRKTASVDFEVGDIVMLESKAPPKTPAPKLYPLYVGPYRIVRMLSNTVIGVEPLGHRVNGYRTIHTNKVRLCGELCVPNPDMKELVSPWTGRNPGDANLDEEMDDTE